ncbi:hypothetical protein F5880DRAFT_1553188 [Lentinula raphanica]|nr:hypothetical protein F5880DRAFT_1553188 [Lentinula raphanica]
MTTRPKRTRPNSAVYLGSDPLHLASTPPGIPDLPEPPSPVSSTGSGLPSPPATNSTGSGSTGDPASIAIRGTARTATSMLETHNIKEHDVGYADGPSDDDDDDDYHNDHETENENDADDTARLSHRHFKSVSVNENALAIQRALTLKERTRMTIDKLASYSRNTPSPSAHTRSSDSSSSTSHRRLLEQQQQSGSETERELADSESRPFTPKFNRIRLVSAPTSPGKALSSTQQSTSSNSSDSPARTRKRVSMAASDLAEVTFGRRVFSPDGFENSKTSKRLSDVAQAALAAVASTRGRISPTSSTKKRQPLPKEFFNATTSSSTSGSTSTPSGSRRGSLSSSNVLDNGRPSADLSTLHQTPRPSSSMKHLQLSPRQQKNLNNALTHSAPRHTFSDPRPNAERSSTLRRHQTGGRWVSEDISVTSLQFDGEDDGAYQEAVNLKGRRQTLRTGGSADSALTIGAGRSLVGEGLKAAGLRNGGTVGRRNDLFDSEMTPLREKVARDRERAQRREALERSLSRTGLRSRSRNDWDDDEGEGRFPHTRSLANGDIPIRAGSVIGNRASTSMAILDHEPEGVGGEREPRTAPPHLRSYKSSYDLVISQETPSRREIDSGIDSLKEREGRYAPSPFASTRRFIPNATANGAETSHPNVPDRSDHNRLLHDSLHMFENHVTRVPSTSSATANDLLRNAQNITSAAEKLNLMTRLAMSRALDAQINAEVDGGSSDSAADIWRTVGADYRDQIRVSDELVRSVTDFLLGIGRAIKDMTGTEEGHGRGANMDEFGGRLTRSSLNSDGGSNGSGRRSEESRRSWGDDIKRLSTDSKRPDSVSTGRPLSVLNLRNHEAPISSGSRQLNNNVNTNRMQDSGRGGLVTLDSQETVHAATFDPSPTPASRQSNRNQDRSGANLDRARTLPPLSIPKSSVHLPSEPLARRQTQTPATSTGRRRPTTAASNTVRAPFPLTSPNMPTTALTPHTVSNSERQDLLLRSNSGSGSGKSSGTTPRSTVTFSRSSTVSALTGLQQQQQLAEQQRQRKRTQSNSSASGAEAVERVSRSTRITSGSETERPPTRTIGRLEDRSRISIEGPVTSNGNVHPADRSAASLILTNTKPRERRKTVVDMWPRG